MELFLFVEGKLCGFLVFSGLLKCDFMDLLLCIMKKDCVLRFVFYVMIL